MNSRGNRFHRHAHQSLQDHAQFPHPPKRQPFYPLQSLR
jgi:hypothetical protein